MPYLARSRQRLRSQGRAVPKSPDGMVVRRRCDKGTGPAFEPHFRAKGNFKFAARAVRWKYQVDGTAKLMGNEIADEAAAIAGWHRSRDRRAAQPPPCERPDHRRLGADAVPTHRHSSVPAP